jgi:threonine dehydrogenase-like Zn-dependent dehydrogenase
MKAIVLKEFGGPEMMAYADIDTPSPTGDQILIKVMNASVNRPDVIQRQGNYPPPPGDSEVLGLEVAGIVEAVGADATRYKIGDRVFALVGGGGYAEYALAYEEHAMSIPDNVSFEQAACICETYITAYLNLFMLGEVEGRKSVLIHGGGGGVATSAIQLCKALTPETEVIVTASSGKLERVAAQGADYVIDYREQDFAEEIRRITDRRGVDVILDHIGAKQGRAQPGDDDGQAPAHHRLGFALAPGDRKSRHHRPVRSSGDAAVRGRHYRTADRCALPAEGRRRRPPADGTGRPLRQDRAAKPGLTLIPAQAGILLPRRRSGISAYAGAETAVSGSRGCVRKPGMPPVRRCDKQ